MKLPEYISLVEKSYFFKHKVINSMEDFQNFWNDEKSNSENVIYRGVHEAKYKLFTSAQREWITKEYKIYGLSFNNYVQSIINNLGKNKKLSTYYQSLGIKENDLLYLSLLQHYGAPTPFLDFTYDKKVALYFALEKMQQTPSSIDVDNYFSIYIIDKTQCGNQLGDLIEILKKGLEKGEEMIEDYRKKYPEAIIDSTSIRNLDAYVAYMKSNNTEQLASAVCALLDNPQYINGQLKMKETDEILRISNLNLIAQNGCFIMYTKDELPLERYFHANIALPPITCFDIHKSLAEQIKESYINDLNSDYIYPSLYKMCEEAYSNYKKGVRVSERPKHVVRGVPDIDFESMRPKAQERPLLK